MLTVNFEKILEVQATQASREELREKELENREQKAAAAKQEATAERAREREEQREVVLLDRRLSDLKKSLISKINNCDGTNTVAVRRWIKDIDSVEKQEPKIVLDVVIGTATGLLIGEADRFIKTVSPLGDPRWTAMRQHLIDAFLGSLRDSAYNDLLTMRQRPSEGPLEFMLKFREIAEDAYPGKWDDGVNDLLLKQLAMALDPPIAEDLMRIHRPETLKRAEAAVREIVKVKNRLPAKLQALAVALPAPDQSKTRETFNQQVEIA